MKKTMSLQAGDRCHRCGDPHYFPRRISPAGHTGPALQRVALSPAGGAEPRPYAHLYCSICVGRGALTPPPGLVPHFHVKSLSLRASDRRHWCGDPHPLVPCHQCPQMPTESSALLSCAHKNCPACRIGIPSGRRGFCFFERWAFRLTGPGKPPECRRWYPRHRCRR